MQGAKFLYHGESKVNPHQGDTPYSDVELVQELRAMLRDRKQEAKVAPPATDTGEREGVTGVGGGGRSVDFREWECCAPHTTR